MIKEIDLESLTTIRSLQDSTSKQICICEFNSGATVDIQLSASSSLAYGSIDIDLSIPSLQLKLKTSNISNLLQVLIIHYYFIYF